MGHKNHPMNCSNCAMKWGFALAFGLMLFSFAAEGQQSTYNNSGTITGIPPNVDATNFYNSGSWNISTIPPNNGTLPNGDQTAFPYETAHTLNYTNVGTMICTVGWEFDYGPL